MKIDPYKHKERYLKWKERINNGIPDISKENSDLILRYVFDMERGINIASGSIKGPRGFNRLNTIKDRVILAESDRRTEQVKIAYSDFRYIKNEFSSPTTTFIYGDKTVIIIWSENPIATMIKSKDVVKSNKNHFELLWKIAEK